MKIINKLFIILTITLLFITGCGLKSYTEITYNEFLDKIENKEDFILFVGSEVCSHCQAYKETINRVVKNNQIEIYYIDINNFTDEQASNFNTYVYVNATPTTVFIYDGKEQSTYNRIDGNLSYDKVVDKIKQAGFIEE